MEPVDASVDGPPPADSPRLAEDAFEPYGAVVLVGADLRIRHVTRNGAVVLEAEPQDIVGCPLEEVFVAEDVQRVAALLADRGVPGFGWPRVRLARSGQLRKLHAFEAGGDLVGLDVLPLPGEPPGTDAEAVERVSVWTERLLSCESVDALLEAAVAVARERTGFAGAWVTRLTSAGHSVIEASDNADGSSLAGTRVPADDVPPAPLTVKGRPVPLIVADLSSTPTTLMPPPAAGTRLAASLLQRPFPEYLDRLTELGLRALVSVPVMVDGHLWGRIGSGDTQPRRLTAATQAELGMIGAAVGNHLSELRELEAARERVELARCSGRVIRAIAAARELVDGLAGDVPALLGVCDADGFVASIGGEVVSFGSAPEGQGAWALLSLAARRLHREGAATVTETGIAPQDGVGDAVAGFLALRLSMVDDDLVVWVRSRRQPPTTWLVHRDTDAPPRTLGESVTARQGPGHCARWTEAQLQQADELREAIIEVLAARYRQMETHNAELLRSNEEYDAFAHAAAHDLKAPLRGIRLTTEMLLEDVADRLTGEEPEQFARIMRLGDRMTQLLDDLLAYAHVGREDWAPGPVDLTEAVAEALDLLGDRATGAQVETQPAAFTMDPGALRQVLFNLIGNAVKYSDAPARIGVAVGRLGDTAAPPRLAASAPDTPVLTVRDEGIGIDPGHHDRIFGLFRQVDPQAEGSGAGLALCRLICRRHGGDIWVESAPGAGSAFHVVVDPGARAAGAR